MPYKCQYKTIELFDCIKYDGNNIDECLAFSDKISHVRNNKGDELIIKQKHLTASIDVNDYIIKDNDDSGDYGPYLTVLAEEDFNKEYDII